MYYTALIFLSKFNPKHSFVASFVAKMREKKQVEHY